MRKHDGTGKCVCAVCGEHLKRLGVHVKIHNLAPKEYYDLYIRKPEEGICPVCGKETSFINIEQGYHKYCSYFCLSQSEDRKEKATKTFIEKYGDSNFRNKEKAKQTTIEKYGTPNYRNTEKADSTFKERYGGRGWASDEIKTKYNNTIIDKYGCQFATQNAAVKNKSKQTNIIKYGVDNPAKSEYCKKKAQKTKKDKYGEGTPSIVKKIKETKFKKYGDSNYNNREQCEQTCVNIYGVSNPAQLPDVQQKAALTRKRTSIAIDGTPLDSNWEKAVYNFCILNNIPIERNIPIKFIYKGAIKVTFIDFKINGLLYEVKAKHLLLGCFDYDKKIKIEDKLKIYKDNNITLITDYEDICVKNNIKYIDINLFINYKKDNRDKILKLFNVFNKDIK